MNDDARQRIAAERRRAEGWQVVAGLLAMILWGIVMAQCSTG